MIFGAFDVCALLPDVVREFIRFGIKLNVMEHAAL